MFSASFFILAACIGDLDPDGGWAAPVVSGDYVYLGAKDGRITRLDLNDNGRFDGAWGFPASGVDTLGPIYGTPRVDGDRVIGAAYDCDGLDLIAYRLLLEFGFRRDRVYRAIVKRARDGGNHMVTLWFEDPEDPWILDATGAMTFRMRRFSEIEGWRPRKVFNETVQFATPLKGPGPAND